MSTSKSFTKDALPCREKECEAIKIYVEQNLRQETGGTMYISGMPGTGKTACIMHVLRQLEKSKPKNIKFHCVLTNGMQIVESKVLFVAIHRQLFKNKKKITANTAFLNLQKYFDDKSGENLPVLLLIDEIDVLITKRQQILYRLFDWTTKNTSKLTILAVANTLDLPERMLAHRISSRLGLNRLCFQPYNHSQIEEILKIRIQKRANVQSDALQLIARKVASVSGDLRRALEICQTALEFHKQDLKTNKKCKFNMEHAQKALVQADGGVKVVSIRSSSEHQKLVLKSALAEYNRTGLEEMTLDRIFDHYKDLCKSDDVEVLSDEELFQIVYVLCESRIFIANNNNRYHYKRKLRLNVNPDDLSYALKSK